MVLPRHTRHQFLEGVGTFGIEAQLKARITIVGCGGLGQPVAAALGAAGVGHLTLIDPDCVQESNLGRLPYMSAQDVGQFKVDAMKAFILRNNPLQQVHRLTNSFSPSLAHELLSHTDIVVDATDNWPTRKALGQACRDLNVPLVSGGALATDGWVGVFMPDEAPLDAWLNQPSQMADTCDRVGVASPLVGMIGNLMAMEVLKLIWKRHHPEKWNVMSGQVMFMDARWGEIVTTQL